MEPDILMHIVSAARGSGTDLEIVLRDFKNILNTLSANGLEQIPFDRIESRTQVLVTGTTRTNLAEDASSYVRWPDGGTYTIDANVNAAGDVLQGFNASAVDDLTIVAGTATLTGNPVFGPLQSYSIVFTAADAADVIGGTAAV